MTRIAVILLLIFAGLAQSADPPFKPTLVTVDGKSMPAVELIDSIAKQAGIVVDRSAVPKELKVNLTLKDKPFWEALQQVATSTAHRMVVEGKGDRIVLVKDDSFPRPTASAYGPFRIIMKSITAKRDFEADGAPCDLQLDLHWEPRIPVFRVSGLKTKATMERTGPPGESVSESSKLAVSGYRQSMTAKYGCFPRYETKLHALNGTVTVTAAEKMLRVSFDDLAAKQPTKTVEKVTVTLLKWEKVDDLWEARVELTYPPGMPEFESFEAECWLRDNACRLISPDRSKSFDSKDQLVRITPTGAVIDYRFHEDNKKGIKPGSGGWHLEIDTPSPLKEFAVPFELKNIPLP